MNDLTTISTLFDALKHGGHSSGAGGTQNLPHSGIGAAFGNLDGSHHVNDLLKPDGSR